MRSSTEHKESSTYDIGIVGAGPVGCILACELIDQAKIAQQDISVVMYERHKQYERTQNLKLDLETIKNEEIKQDIMRLVAAGQAKRIAKTNNIDIPIKTLETCLVEHVKKRKIKIIYKEFITREEYKKLENHSEFKTREAVEKLANKKFVVGVEELNCKMIIGADGSRSTVRQLIVDDKKNPTTKTDLRNMIEVKYQVEGEARTMGAFENFTTQLLLNGFLCLEHIKRQPGELNSQITLRFLVDDETFNDSRLNGVNAKNLLPLTYNIPKKLRDAINKWVNQRGDDTGIVPLSATINKTNLSIYTSKQFSDFDKNLILLLIGDAACGFAFMTGLNLGIDAATILAKMIISHYHLITDGNEKGISDFLNQYNQLLEKTFRKGSDLVNQANNKISKNEKIVKSAYYSTLPIKSIRDYSLSESNPIFEASYHVNLLPLIKYINKNARSSDLDFYRLSNNLLNKLTDENLSYDFNSIYSLLHLAYCKNLNLEKRKAERSPHYSFWSYLGFPIVESAEAIVRRTSLELKECKDEKEIDIPLHLPTQKGKKLSEELHRIIRDIYTRTVLFETQYGEQTKRLLSVAIPEEEKSNFLIGEYVGLKLR